MDLTQNSINLSVDGREVTVYYRIGQSEVEEKNDQCHRCEKKRKMLSKVIVVVDEAVEAYKEINLKGKFGRKVIAEIRDSRNHSQYVCSKCYEKL